MRQFRTILVGAFAALLAASCGGRPEAEPVAGAQDLRAALESARLMHEIGLQEAALSECRFVEENAREDVASLVAEALLLGGDCERARGGLDAAIRRYREAASRDPGQEEAARVKVAESYLKGGRWSEALAELRREGASPADERGREAAEALAAKILPITRLDHKMAWTFGGGPDPDAEAGGGVRTWIVRDPLRVSRKGEERGDGALHARIQKTAPVLARPIPWEGGSFRLEVRFRIDAVDAREHMIGAAFGVDTWAALNRFSSGEPAAADRLAVKWIARTNVLGRRDKVMAVDRLRSAAQGAGMRGCNAAVHGDLPLDVWLRATLEYSRELASLRVRLSRPESYIEDKTLSDQVVENVEPFGPGPFALFLGLGEGGDAGYAFDLSVDLVRFEAAAGIREPDEAALAADGAVLAGNRCYFLRNWGAALKNWEAELAGPRLSLPVRIAAMKACFQAGEFDRAKAAEDSLAARAAEFTPRDVDDLALLAHIDPDAERLCDRILRARGEKR